MVENEEHHPEITLTARRSRRANAGNKLQALCAEVAAKAIPDPEDVDVDFRLKYQKDEYDEAFASTDEEVDIEEVAMQGNAAEVTIAQEDRAIQKKARARRERANKAAVARQRVTFDPEVHAAALRRGEHDISIRRPSRHEQADGMAIRIDKGKRKSSRAATVSSTEDVRNKLKEADKQRAAQRRRDKAPTKDMTQDDYIRRALEREEGNILEHRSYLSTEEERRRRAKVTRPVVQGPVLRWVSRVEERPVPEIIVLDDDEDESPTPRSGVPEAMLQTALPTHQHTSTTKPIYLSGDDIGSAPLDPEHMDVGAHDSISHIIRPTVRVTRNYLVHAIDQEEDIRKPRWRETMRALFGDHVRWEDLKVYTDDKRPLARSKETCPLTGKPAKYKDPRTGVAFADVQAYATLTRLLEHSYMWSDTLGCYVDRRGSNA